MLRFNLNNSIKVKPSKRGWTILKEEGCTPEPDGRGYILMQAWHVMSIFGSDMRLGWEPLIELEILIDEKDLMPETPTLSHLRQFV